MLKKIIAVTAAGVALAAIGTPASATITLAFDGTSGSYKDSGIASGAYTSDASFNLTSSGDFLVSFHAFVKNFTSPVAYITNLTSKMKYYIPLTSTSGSSAQTTGSLDVTDLAKGFYSLTVTGSVPKKTTGAFSGDISFTPAAVPEPAAWALMITGIGFAGGSLRLRSRRTSVRFA